MEQSPAMFNAFYNYEIVRELGRGTTGTVYEARHSQLNRRVALKVPTLLPDAERDVKVQRLYRECRALASLTGASGTPAEVDVRGLQDLLRWLCGALRHSLRTGLERALGPGAVATAGAFGTAVVSHLRCDPA